MHKLQIDDNGSPIVATPRRPFQTTLEGVVLASYNDVDPGFIAKSLNSVGICVWDGNFYAPRPVDILNIPGGSLLRVGFSMYNTKDEADRLVTCVAALAQKK